MASHTAPVRYDFLNDTIMRRINYRVARLSRKYCLSAEDRQDLRQEFCLTMFRAGERYKAELCIPERFVRMVLKGGTLEVRVEELPLRRCPLCGGRLWENN